MRVRLLLLLIALGTRPAMAGVDPFIRPDGSAAATPVWGVRDGIQIGLWPTAGPRGLLRIYTPYLGRSPGRIMNFIAIEPITNGHRDLSELQFSSIDHKQGKMMWTADTVDLAHPPVLAPTPARGVVTNDVGGAALTLFLLVEPFDNGARPVIKLTLRSDRPHEIRLQTFAAAGSAPMQSCVLTATMGNHARLRHLQLNNHMIDAADVFRGKQRGNLDFYPWCEWPGRELMTRNGRLTVSATGDLDPQPEPAGVPKGWRYEGRPAVQTWSTLPRPGVLARVNGRSTFWGTHADIPGGPAFENFELLAQFGQGDEFRFAVDERD